MQTKDGRRQITARLKPETVDAIDARRGAMSRDEWLQRMAEHCLSLPINPPKEEKP